MFNAVKAFCIVGGVTFHSLADPVRVKRLLSSATTGTSGARGRRTEVVLATRMHRAHAMSQDRHFGIERAIVRAGRNGGIRRIAFLRKQKLHFFVCSGPFPDQCFKPFHRPVQVVIAHFKHFCRKQVMQGCAVSLSGYLSPRNRHSSKYCNAISFGRDRRPGRIGLSPVEKYNVVNLTFGDRRYFWQGRSREFNRHLAVARGVTRCPFSSEKSSTADSRKRIW